MNDILVRMNRRTIRCSTAIWLACASLAGCSKERKPGNPSPNSRMVPISHAQIEPTAHNSVRLHAREDLWVEVTDANPLIYDYSLTRQPNPESEAVRQSLRGLLGSGGMVVPGTLRSERVGNAREVEDCPTGPSAGANSTLRALATNVLTLGRVLTEILRFTDGPYANNADAVAQVARKCTLKGGGDFQLTAYLSSEAELQSLLNKRHSEAATPGPVPEDQEALYRTALAAIPAVIYLWHGLQSVNLGSLFLHHDGAESQEELIELSITNRLGDAYRPRRWTGTGVDIATTKPAFRTIEVSAGMAGVWGDRTEFSLERFNTAGTDSFRIQSVTHDRFSITPSLLVSWLPVQRGDYVFGITGGVGISSGNVAQITDATDLMLMLTAGRDWLRVSAGIASTSEISSLNGLVHGDTTTNPNLLNEARRDRKTRGVVSIHLVP
jgi:hypothetical protein